MSIDDDNYIPSSGLCTCLPPIISIIIHSPSTPTAGYRAPLFHATSTGHMRVSSTIFHSPRQCRSTIEQVVVCFAPTGCHSMSGPSVHVPPSNVSCPSLFSSYFTFKKTNLKFFLWYSGSFTDRSYLKDSLQ